MNAPGRILPDLRAAAALRAAEPRPRGRTPRVTAAAVLACHERGLSIEQMMAELACSRATVEKRRRELGLVGKVRRGRKAGKAASAGPRRESRHAARPAVLRPATMPPADHPAFAARRSLHQHAVAPVDGTLNVLVSGFNTGKIGGEIRKGRWKGFPVYTVTLEERATCPVSCAHWRSCYGNGMHFAKRLAHGPAFEERLGHELGVAASRHPGGFAVRLHLLGDFYSVAYVGRWRGWLEAFPPLHVFGFTARIDRGDAIAEALVRLVLERWERFAIRFSNAPVDECATVSIEHPLQRPADAVVCPQQLGLTESCSSCAFCWQSRRRVAFVRH